MMIYSRSRGGCAFWPQHLDHRTASLRCVWTATSCNNLRTHLPVQGYTRVYTRISQYGGCAGKCLRQERDSQSRSSGSLSLHQVQSQASRPQFHLPLFPDLKSVSPHYSLPIKTNSPAVALSFNLAARSFARTSPGRPCAAPRPPSACPANNRDKSRRQRRGIRLLACNTNHS